jgi:hypothetical protein
LIPADAIGPLGGHKPLNGAGGIIHDKTEQNLEELGDYFMLSKIISFFWRSS